MWKDTMANLPLGKKGKNLMSSKTMGNSEVNIVIKIMEHIKQWKVLQ